MEEPPTVQFSVPVLDLHVSCKLLPEQISTIFVFGRNNTKILQKITYMQHSESNL